MRRWFRHLHFKLREQLLFGVVLMVIIPVLAVGFWVNHHVSVNLHQEALRETAQVADNLSLTLEHLLEMHKSNLLAAAAGLGEWGDPEGRKANLEAIYRSGNRWSQVAYWDAGTGQRLADLPSGATTLTTAQSQSWFEQSLGQEGVLIDRLPPGANGSGEGLLFAVAVHDQRGQKIGVLSTGLSESDLRQQLQQTLSLPAQSRVWLVNRDQHFVLEPRSFPGEPERYDPAFLQQLEQTHVVSVRSLKTTGWQLIVAQDQGTVFADAGQLSWEIVLITTGILLAALFLALWYVRSFLKPVQQVMSEIHALSEGYSVEDLPALATRQDELGEVSAAFRNLAGQMQEMSRDLILALVAALEARDSYTKYHSERVALYAQLLARELGVDPVRRENILRAGFLHDLGKIGVPGSILNKPGALNAEELAVMRSHALQSYEIIREVPYYAESGIAEAVLQHHERWDGSGYPQGLSGETIRLEARILAVADAFDAMTSNRVYRKALGLEEALSELERGSGEQFAPECVSAFLRIPVEELRRCLGVSIRSYVQRSRHTEAQAS